MTEEKYYKPCSTCHNDDCVWMGGQDTHKKCEDYQPLEQEPILDKIRAEISEYGALWVEYKIEGHSDKDIEKIVEKVLKQAKQQVLEIIDKYRQEI